jgi:hypothetical protein
MSSESVWLKLVTVTSLAFAVVVAVSAHRGESVMHKTALSYCPDHGCHVEPDNGGDEWASMIWDGCHHSKHVEACVYSWTMAYVYGHLFRISSLFLIAIAMPVTFYVFEEAWGCITREKRREMPDAPVPDSPDSSV